MTNASVRPSDKHNPVECSATAGARALKGLYGMDTMDLQVQRDDWEIPADVEAGASGESPEEHPAKRQTCP